MRRRRRRIFFEAEDEDPMSGVANLFDVAMVFAVALLIALVVSYSMPELLNPSEDVTMVKNPGEANMQIIIKKGEKIEVMNMTEKLAGGEGTVLGTAYRLKDGTVIYVPENATGGM
jgi:hypothetical protein